MSGPPVIQAPGLGEQVASTLGGIAQTLQKAAEFRQEQQANAVRNLLAQSQIQEQQAQTEHTQTETAGARAAQAQAQRVQREKDMDEQQYQQGMGQILHGFAQAGGDITAQAYKDAVGRAIASVDRPGAATLLHDRLTQFYGDLTAAPKAAADIATAGVTTAEAPNKITTAQAETQLLTDPQQRRLAAMHNAGTLPVYLEQLSHQNQLQLEALRTQNDERSRNAQADILRRTLVTDALKAGYTAYNADPSRTKGLVGPYLQRYLQGAASQIIDPQTGQPMSSTDLSTLAGQIVRGVRPTVPSATPDPATPRAPGSARIPSRNGGESDADYWERLKRAGLSADSATAVVRRAR